MSLRTGRAVWFVAQQLDPRQAGRRVPADGQHLIVGLLGQVRRDMAKLAGEILVYEQHFHPDALSLASVPLAFVQALVLVLPERTQEVINYLSLVCLYFRTHCHSWR